MLSSVLLPILLGAALGNVIRGVPLDADGWFQLALFTTFHTDSAAWHIIVVTMVMALGMANVMAPCTDSIMGSLPRAKAGVGSAVNDTTRQFGGALGVAVYGSLLASRYTDHVTSRLSGRIPASLLGPAKDSVGGVVEVAQPGGLGGGRRRR